MALRIREEIKVIENMVGYYQEETKGFNSQLKDMLKSIEEVFKSRSINSELEKKLEEEIARVKNKYQVEKDTLENTNGEKEAELNAFLNAIYAKLEEDIARDTQPVNSLEESRMYVTDKLGKIIGNQEASLVFPIEDIKQASIKDIHNIINEAKNIEDMIKNLEIASLDLSAVQPDFWFPAGRFNDYQNENLENLARALNIMAVVLIVAFQSNLIVTGLTGYTGYLIFNNYKVMKPIKNQKDFIYTAYEYQTDFIKHIENIHQTNVQGEINNIKRKISEIQNEHQNQLREINNREQEEISKLQSEFEKERENKAREIEEQLSEEKSKVISLSEKLNENIQKEVLRADMQLDKEKERLELVLEELNNFDLEIVNSNQIFNLEKYHLGQEITDESVKFFSDLKFGSYIFTYTDDKESMRTLMKYMLVQSASRMQGNLIDFNILDPVEFGEGLGDIVDGDSVGKYFNDTEVKDKIEQLISRFTSDAKSTFIGYDDIIEYNKEKVNTGSAPYKYVLNLIQNLDLFENISQMKRLVNTKRSGVINYILVSEARINEIQSEIEGDEVETEEFLSLLKTIPMIFSQTPSNHIQMEGSSSITNKIENEDGEEDIVVHIKEELDSKIRQGISEINFLAGKYGVKGIEFIPMEYGGVKDLDIPPRDMFQPLIIERKTFQQLGKDIKENQDKAAKQIFYFNDFVKRSIGDSMMDKLPVNGINARFGYWEGDVEKPSVIEINDKEIHWYLAGATGFGKSNTMNVAINTMVREYSPENLNIYYLDFKTVEGKQYQRNPTPHFKCISTTADPYYLLSLFRYIIQLMEHRQNVVLPSYNADKLSVVRKANTKYLEWEKEVKDKGLNPEEELNKKFAHVYDEKENNEGILFTAKELDENFERAKREFKGARVSEILIIIDEFTEGLKTEPEVKKEILEAIDSFARLGRATGVHLFLTSQDVSDDLDEGTMGQLSGRLSLPVENARTSKQIIGNEAAANSDFRQMGNLMLNKMGGDPDYNRLIKVPLITSQDFDVNLREVARVSHERGFKLNCVMFDEKSVRTDEVLNELLDMASKGVERYVKVKKDPTSTPEQIQQAEQKSILTNEQRNIILGDNAQFTTSDSPIGFPLRAEDSNNIVIYSQSRSRRIELENTIVANFAKIQTEEVELFIFRGNKDFATYDVSEPYEKHFSRVEEVENLEDYLSFIKETPLALLEAGLNKYGWELDEYIDYTEDELLKMEESDPPTFTYQEEYLGFDLREIFTSYICEQGNFREDWKRFKAEQGGEGTGMTDRMKSRIMDLLRPYVPTRLLIMEGIEEIEGIGFQAFDAQEINEVVKYGPYYKAYSIWTGSLVPNSWDRYKDSFRHSILGTLSRTDSIEYRFMRNTPDTYAGYQNSITPDDAFKFKRFKIEVLGDDAEQSNIIELS